MSNKSASRKYKSSSIFGTTEREQSASKEDQPVFLYNFPNSSSNYARSRPQYQETSFKQDLSGQAEVDAEKEAVEGKIEETKLNDETKEQLASKMEGGQIALSNKAAKFAGVIALIVMMFLLFVFGFIWWVCFKSKWSEACVQSGTGMGASCAAGAKCVTSFGNSAKSV